MRSLIAVLTGAVVWAVVWLGFNQLLLVAAPGAFAVDQPITSVGGLMSMWLVCIALSIAAGYLTGLVAGAREVAHASILGVLQLGLGIYFQLEYWELMPVWYHVVFLLILFPAHAYGGVLRRARMALGGASMAAA